MKKNPLKEWFIFTRRDRNAAFILLALLVIIIILPCFLPSKELNIHVNTALQAELDRYKQLNIQPLYATSYVDTAGTDSIQVKLFYFDPNTLSEEGFIKLGLSPKTAHTIINYRGKGGHFKTPQDIRKIYSLSKTDADRIIPYARISQPIHEPGFSESEKPQAAFKSKPTYTTNQFKKTEINMASVEDWKAFPGIGDVLANRIVKFRTSMGGFKSVDQVAKTYGLSDSVFQVIKPYLYIKD